jgi:hypothetical protein
MTLAVTPGPRVGNESGADGDRRAVNIFLLHTPFQLYIAEYMALSIAEWSGRSNVALVDNPTLEPNVDIWNEIRHIRPNIGPGLFGNAGRIKREIRRLEARCSTAEHVQLFISNFDYPLGNAMYAWARTKPGVEVAAYPEGIANILRSRFGWKKKIKNRIKQLYGKMHGLYIQHLGDDLSGLAIADVIYTLLPAVELKTRARIVPIPRPATSAVPSLRHGCLVCGQPLYAIMPREEHESLTQALIDLVHDLGFSRVVYKPHPREDESIDRVAVASNATVLRDSRVAEVAFDQDGFECIASFCSSALLHVKLLHGPNARAIAFRANDVLSRSNNNRQFAAELKSIFVKFGVEWR